MSVQRAALTSVAALTLLFALPTHTTIGPDLAFGKGGDGGDGGHGGGGNGAGGGGGHGGGDGGHGGGNGGGGAGGAGGGAGGGPGGTGGASAGGSASAGASGAGSGTAGVGTPNGGSGSQAAGNGGGRSANDNGALAAFVASPVFSHVAATVPTTITATPVVVSRLGVQCQTITQTVEIDGQNVRASAVLCQQPDGTWQIAPTRSARVANAKSTPAEIYSLVPPSIER